MNNFNYELLRYISELTNELEAQNSSSTYNKFIENEEKINVTLDNVKMRQRKQNLQNEILRENLERQMTKQLALENKLKKIMQEKPQLQWDYQFDEDERQRELSEKESNNNLIRHFKEKEFQEAKNNFLENLCEESNAILINDLRRREDIRNGNINNLSRQIEVLNDNLLNNKLPLNSIDVLNTNGDGSHLDQSQLNALDKYLYEDNTNDSQLIDTLGVLKDEILKTNAAIKTIGHEFSIEHQRQ